LRGNIRNENPWRARHYPGVEASDWSGDQVEAIAPVTWQSQSNTMNGLRQEKNTGVRRILIGKRSVLRRRQNTKSGWAFRISFKKKTGRYERVFSQYLIKVALNKYDALDRGLAERALGAAIPVGSRFRASSPSNTISSQVCKITILLQRMGKASFTIDEHPPSSRRACPLLRLGPCVSVRPMHPQMR